MRLRSAGVVLLCVVGVPSDAWPQRTRDQARLIFTVAGGVVGGKRLWAASPQPVQFVSPADTFALARRIRSTLAITLGGAYYPGDNLGFSAEGFLVGLGYEDNCTHLFSSGSADVATVCRSIQGSQKPATAVVLAGGPVYRVNSRKRISPYARLNAGLLFTTQSSLRTFGQFDSDSGAVSLIVYDDDRSTRVTPALTLGLGFTVAVGNGYQLRWEVRDNLVGVATVTAPTPQARVVPPHETEYKHVFSLTVGFDFVLERRPGRRY